MFPQTLVLTLFLTFLALPSPVWAWSARVVSVHDGDSLRVRDDAGTITVIRLYAIDAPEMGTEDWPEQPYARESRRELERLLPRNTPVDIRVDQKSTSHGRTVATVLLPDGREVNRIMLEKGAAWFSSKHCRSNFCDAWRKAERRARGQKIGLWGGHDPLPPWTWKGKYGN